MVSAIVATAAVIGALAQATVEDDGAMAAARHALQHHHGNTVVALLRAERFEYQPNDALLIAEMEGWIGGDLRKVGLTLEAERDFDAGSNEELELRALYQHAISAFWNLQMGVRQDLHPEPKRSYATVGLAGLAPFWFEVESALFVSDQGDVALRLEAEYDWRLTQRWLLAPRIEANIGSSRDRDLNLGKGLRDIEWGLRLRFAITPQLAPYIGFEQSRSFGSTRTAARVGGASHKESRWVAGVRFWL
ncbi:MAG: copper resistance protein B [Pseudomonadales bacterium]